MLQPVRESYVTGKPIEWTRVHDKPDFVYFNHSIHVKKGIGCVSCHGRVDEMPLTWQAESMSMSWCVDCHRHPERHIRPRHAVYKMDWKPSDEGPGVDQVTLGRQLVQEYKIRPAAVITNCSICHR